VRELQWKSCWLVLWRGTRPAIVAGAPRGVARQPSVLVFGQNDSTARMEVIVTAVEANSNCVREMNLSSRKLEINYYGQHIK